MINDTSDFFNMDDFAEYVTVSGKKIKAIFDRVVTEHSDGISFVKGYRPQIVCQTADFNKSGGVQGDLVVVRKSNYEITDIEADGTGVTTVTLFEKIT